MSIKECPPPPPAFVRTKAPERLKGGYFYYREIIPYGKYIFVAYYYIRTPLCATHTTYPNSYYRILGESKFHYEILHDQYPFPPEIFPERNSASKLHNSDLIHHTMTPPPRKKLDTETLYYDKYRLGKYYYECYYYGINIEGIRIFALINERLRIIPELCMEIVASNFLS